VVLSDPDDLHPRYLPDSRQRRPVPRYARRPIEAWREQAEGGAHVRHLLLLAETGLQARRFEYAGQVCASAWAAVRQLPVVEPGLVATVSAVNAQVCVAARAPGAVQACRRYHAAAVDEYVAGDRRRLFYAQALNAVLLTSVNPVAAGDAFARLLRRPGLTVDDMVVAERALLAARTRNTGPVTVTDMALPPVPGGALLSLDDRPDPDCLARLVLLPTPAGDCQHVADSGRPS
jgi:hypothetical protein